MNTRLPDLLHDLASEMPTETRTPARRTLRRARTRRASVAALGSVALVAVVLGTLAGLRAVAPADSDRRPIVPGTDAPAGFQGLWPETDAGALAETQAATDDGHQPLRLDPAQTAVMLSTNLFGWIYDSVEAEIVDRGDASAVVEIRTADLPEDVPPVAVGVAQLGHTGPAGVWSVVTVTSPLIEGIALDAPPQPDGTVGFSGTFGDVGDSFSIRFEVLAGSVSVLTAGGPLAIDGDGFAGSWIVETTDPDPVALWIHVIDDAGTTLGAATLPIGSLSEPPVPTPTATPSTDFTDLPPDVAATAQRIYDGALARDFDALAELLDPNTFAYNFDDGSDPIPAWREDPSDLDLAAAILELPAAEPREIVGYGTFYLWPYLIDSDFSALTEQERADLAFLGYSDEEIQLMIDGDYGYQGPRLGVDTDGLWRNFTTVGE